MADSIADELIKRQEQLASDRSSWEKDWEDVTLHVIPQAAFAFGLNPRGRNRSQVVDDTAKDCLDNLVAGIDGLMFGERAYEVKHKRDEAQQDETVKGWSEYATTTLNAALLNPKAGYAPERQKVVRSLGGYGTGCLYSDHDPGRHLVIRSIPLAQLYVAENSNGRVDTVFRRFNMTARQAVEKFGEGRVSESIRKAMEKEPFRRFAFLHFVCPRDAYDFTRKDRLNMPVADHYIEVDARKHVLEGGYHEMPYHVTRWDGVEDSPFGWSPALTVLDDIKRVNAMGRTNLKAGHASVEPALYIRNGLFKGKLDRRPNAINFYNPDRSEQVEVRQLPGPTGLPVTLEMEQDRREFIRAAFYYFLLQIPQNPQMTATEWLGRVQEMMRRMGRPVGNIQMEMAQPVGERALNIMMRVGAIKPPPLPLRREDFKVEFLSPVKRAQQAAEAEGTLRTIQGIGAIAGIDPSVTGLLDGDKAVRHLREANGAPHDIIRGEREMTAIRQKQAEAAQAAQMANMTTQGAGVVRDLSEAAKNVKFSQGA